MNLLTNTKFISANLLPPFFIKHIILLNFMIFWMFGCFCKALEQHIPLGKKMKHRLVEKRILIIYLRKIFHENYRTFLEFTENSFLLVLFWDAFRQISWKANWKVVNVEECAKENWAFVWVTFNGNLLWFIIFSIFVMFFEV